MIPRAYIQEWSAQAPWADLRLVEQDLIVCRALCDLFNAPKLKNRIAFRGGTAIHKLLFRQPLRYSEDIDLVQARPERIGPTIDAVREALAWLGDCARDRTGHSLHLIFRFAPETAPDTELNLKVEINTREHASLLGFKTYAFELVNSWHEARTDIVSFSARRSPRRLSCPPACAASCGLSASRAPPPPSASRARGRTASA